MPDIEKLLDGETEKRFLKHLFPGFLATWPALLSTIKYVTTNEFWKAAEGNSTLNIALFVVLFAAVYGIGHILSKIGLRIEVMLDEWYCANNKQGVTADDFDKAWYAYLEKTVVGPNSPVIIKYYSGFVTAYQFELTCQVAVFVQLIMMIAFDVFYGHFLSVPGYIIIGLLSVVVFIYLRFESRKAVGQAHILRTKINAIHTDGEVPPPSVSGIATGKKPIPSGAAGAENR